MDSSDSPLEAGGALHPNGEIPEPSTCDVKSHLTKEHHTILERYFQVQCRPSAHVKKDFASVLGVPLYKINVSDDPSRLLHAYDILT
jgi:hypothetical protein